MTGSWAANQTDADLFSLAHRAVCHVLLSCEKLTDVVRVGNIHLYADKMPGQPAKPVRAEADLPELHIYPSGLNLNGSPSDGNHYTQLYTVAHSTGETRVDKGHNQIKFGVLYAINRQRLSALGMPASITHIRCINYIEQVATNEQGIKTGWTGAATLEVRLKIADWEVGV